MSCGWVMSAMTRRRPPQRTQVVTSISNVRLSRSAQVIPWDLAGGGESTCGFFWSVHEVEGAARRGTICFRKRLLGAKTP